MNVSLYPSGGLTKEAAVKAADAVMQRNNSLKELELEVCKITGARYAEAVDKVSSALCSLLYAWSVCRGEAVFVPSFTELFVLLAVMECGATPVLVDCDRETWNMNPQKLESAVKRCIKQNGLYPRAVIVSDIFGMPFDTATISSVCAKYGLLLIEEASSALGASFGGKNAGTFGEGAVMGLRSPMNENGYNNGAAVLTDDEKLAKIIKITACGGQKYFTATGAREAVRRGNFSKLDAFTAELLMPQLKDAESAVAKRRKTAERLKKAINGTAAACQSEKEGVLCAYPVFAVRASDKESADRMVKAFREDGIECRAVFSKPLCRHAAFKEFGVNTSDVPVGSELSVCTFMLPCHEELTEEQIEYICRSIKKNCI